MFHFGPTGYELRFTSRLNLTSRKVQRRDTLSCRPMKCELTIRAGTVSVSSNSPTAVIEDSAPARHSVHFVRCGLGKGQADPQAKDSVETRSAVKGLRVADASSLEQANARDFSRTHSHVLRDPKHKATFFSLPSKGIPFRLATKRGEAREFLSYNFGNLTGCSGFSLGLQPAS